MRSATGSPRSRIGPSTRSPSATGPLYTPMRTATGLPWIDSGRNGAGGAVARLSRVVASSGRSLQNSR